MKEAYKANSCRHLPFDERMKIKDNLSNLAFRAFCKENGIIQFKFGVDGSEVYKPYQMNHIMRHAPDKLCIPHSGDYFLTDLKGCKGQWLRIKRDCLADYLEWSKLFNVNVFAFNSDTNKYSIVPLLEIASIAEQVGLSYDPSMGEIYLIPCDMLKWNELPIFNKPQYADNYNK